MIRRTMARFKDMMVVREAAGFGVDTPCCRGATGRRLAAMDGVRVMPIVPIDDLDDPRIAIYRSLKATNRTRGLDQFVVEGGKLVERLLASRYPVVSMLATDRDSGHRAVELPPEIPLYVVPFALIHDIVGYPFHRGVLASARRIPWPPWQELFAGRDRLTLAACPVLSNPENLGSLARIGDVLGVDAILAGPSCPDSLSRRVLRVSMGATLRLPIIISDRLDALAVRLMAEHDVEFWAAVADPSAPSFDAQPRPARLALVLGDEDRGVDAEWIRRCRRSVTIPMRAGASSLNVSVAAGILLYHFSRPRAGSGAHPAVG
jgi:tRNA G18 (ribose-2'-O)-methylase SpoU